MATPNEDRHQLQSPLDLNSCSSGADPNSCSKQDAPATIGVVCTHANEAEGLACVHKLQQVTEDYRRLDLGGTAHLLKTPGVTV